MTNKLLYSISILLLIVIVAMLIVRTDSHLTFLGRVGASVMIILAWDIVKTMWRRFNE